MGRVEPEQKTWPGTRVREEEIKDRLGLEASDDPSHGARNAIHGTTLEKSRYIGFRIKAGIAGARRITEIEHRKLPFVADAGAAHEWPPQAMAGSVDLIAGLKIVARVNDQIHRSDGLFQGRGSQTHGQHLEGQVRVMGAKAGCSGFDLEPAHVAFCKKKLTVEVGLIDPVEIVEQEGSDSGTGEIEGDRATETAEPHEEHTRLSDPFLSGRSPVAEHGLAEAADRGVGHT